MESPPDDYRKFLPRYSKENLDNNQLILDQVQAIAFKYDCSAAQLSLAWLFHKAFQMGVTVIPIPGSTKVHNALSNLVSVNIEIADEDILESLADRVVGDRYTEQMMTMTIEKQQ